MHGIGSAAGLARLDGARVRRMAQGRNLAILAAAFLASSVLFLQPVSARSVPAVNPGSCGSVLLAGSSWLGGQGVDVKSNGQYQGKGTPCGGTNYVNGVESGLEWQCAELVNRLYLTRGWISTDWPGNGGRSSPAARDSMYDEAPGSLSKQPNGSISYLAPGDAVSINVYDGGVFQPDGHVLIANDSVTSGGVTLVSQNGGDPGNAIVTTSATLSGGTLTIPASGSWSYQVIGVVHAPSDLVFIKTKNTGTPDVQVFATSEASGFQKFVIDSSSGFSAGDANNGWFQTGP